MGEHNNQNRLALWGNEEKKTDRSPTHKGKGETVCESCGHVTQVWASGWTRKPGQSERAPAMSIIIEPRNVDNLAHRPDRQAPSRPTPADFDDDIPF